MGYSRSSAADWGTYAASTSTKSYDDLFKTKTVSSIPDDMLPINIKLRESRDSTANPESTAVILAADNTGSMGFIAEQLIRTGLSTTFKSMLERAKPDPITGKIIGLKDPQVMCMAFGDAWCDRSPLTVTQFESDLKITDQTGLLYIEGNGGGNGYESYNLPWYFGANKTAIDCWEKRQQKGFLFTIGDEPPPPRLERAHIKKIFGDVSEVDISSADLLAQVQRMYHVMHVVIEEGSHCQSPRGLKEVRDGWQALLGQDVIFLDDHTKLAETIISAIEIKLGRDRDASAKAWSGSTAMVVARAVSNLATTNTGNGGLTRFA